MPARLQGGVGHTFPLDVYSLWLTPNKLKSQNLATKAFSVMIDECASNRFFPCKIWLKKTTICSFNVQLFIKLQKKNCELNFDS